MPSPEELSFEDPGLLDALVALPAADLDRLRFGVIGFDAEGRIDRYNAHESRSTGLSQGRVLGRPLFTDVAQCMNNYLVAERFVAARAGGFALDETIDYVLTWRMAPTPVRMRLLWSPGARGEHAFVVIQRGR